MPVMKRKVIMNRRLFRSITMTMQTNNGSFVASNSFSPGSKPREGRLHTYFIAGPSDSGN
jgi:hypothetical protein